MSSLLVIKDTSGLTLLKTSHARLKLYKEKNRRYSMPSGPKLPLPPKTPGKVTSSADLCLFCKKPVGSAASYTCPRCQQRYHKACAQKAKTDHQACKKCGQVMLLK